MTPPRFRKCLDFADVPADWQLVTVTLDWNGQPLLLFSEGKPPRPDFYKAPQAWSRWCRTPPEAHHVLYSEAGKVHTLRFEQSQGLSTFHIQRFEEGWLLGQRRGGAATVYDAHGKVHHTLDLGDASQDLQTTPQGHIWVSYFDEGVYGKTIGRQGLICFDGAGTPLFQFGDFAEQNALPMISDCYAMNVTRTGEVWLNYYMDFPLIHLRDFSVEQIWNDFGVLGDAFAVRGDEVLGIHADQLLLSSLLSPPEHDRITCKLEDETGEPLTLSTQSGASVAARGATLVINTGTALYKLLD